MAVRPHRGVAETALAVAAGAMTTAGEAILAVAISKVAIE